MIRRRRQRNLKNKNKNKNSKKRPHSQRQQVEEEEEERDPEDASSDASSPSSLSSPPISWTHTAASVAEPVRKKLMHSSPRESASDAMDGQIDSNSGASAACRSSSSSSCSGGGGGDADPSGNDSSSSSRSRSRINTQNKKIQMQSRRGIKRNAEIDETEEEQAGARPNTRMRRSSSSSASFTSSTHKRHPHRVTRSMARRLQLSLQRGEARNARGENAKEDGDDDITSSTPPITLAAASQTQRHQAGRSARQSADSCSSSCSTGSFSKSPVSPISSATGSPQKAKARWKLAMSSTRFVSRTARSLSIAAKIFSVLGVNDMEQSFDVDVVLIIQWKDPQLIGADPSNVDWSRAWHPRFNVRNAMSVEDLGETRGRRLSDPARGIVKETRRYRGSVSAFMHLDNFPFDQQVLPIVVSTPRPITEAFFEPPSEDQIKLQSIHLHDWSFAAPTTEIVTTDPGASTSGRVYSECHIKLHAMRRYGFFLWNKALVVGLISALGILCFFFDASNLGERLGITCSLLLTAVTFTASVSESMPSVASPTLLDLYVLLCFLLLYGTAIENALVSLISQSETQLLVDRVAFASFILLFVLIHVYVGVRGHRALRNRPNPLSFS